ncbi:uncharacterized protein [Epargyreus clarus]|uniref:uncharacterized protein n=1 Tax=Epargyreus clarus TaxID=520877 RepID=UPI003C2CBB0F
MMIIFNEMLNRTKSRLSGMVRTFGTTPKICASHYDVLGVTPKATQADIKSAYYKLSKLYHPDKSSDEESAKKFRAIKEAYEVLGNVQLKKMYDRGLLVGSESKTRMGGEYRPDPEPTDPTLRFYKSRAHRNVVPTMDGRTPIYDFDEWAKNHYGELLRKSKSDKEFIRHKRMKEMDHRDSVQQEFIIYISAFICFCFIALASYGKSEYDTDTTKKENPQSASHTKNVKTS